MHCLLDECCFQPNFCPTIGSQGVTERISQFQSPLRSPLLNRANDTIWDETLPTENRKRSLVIVRSWVRFPPPAPKIRVVAEAIVGCVAEGSHDERVVTDSAS